MLNMKMDKTPKQVTKDRKRQECGKKWHETYTRRLKEDIRENNQLSNSSSTNNSTSSFSSSADCLTPSTSPSTDNSTTRSSDNYIYCCGAVFMLAIKCFCMQQEIFSDCK